MFSYITMLWKPFEFSFRDSTHQAPLLTVEAGYSLCPFHSTRAPFLNCHFISKSYLQEEKILKYSMVSYIQNYAYHRRFQKLEKENFKISFDALSSGAFWWSWNLRQRDPPGKSSLTYDRFIMTNLLSEGLQVLEQTKLPQWETGNMEKRLKDNAVLKLAFRSVHCQGQVWDKAPDL